MKRFAHQQSAHRGHGLSSPLGVGRLAASRKGGAALIVVISLLGMLAFLGFLFYTFAAQEVASAEYFAAADSPQIDFPPDRFWDWSLEQIILGTDVSLTNSALYGNKYSLLANELGSPNADIAAPGNATFGAKAGPNDLMYGNISATRFADVQPFDGAGITPVVTDLNTVNSPVEFGFDVNQDGVFDPATEPTWQNFVMNFSPAADSPFTGGPYPGIGLAFSYDPTGPTGFPYQNYTPDAGYTYPDINSPFLAYDTFVRGWADSNASGTGTGAFGPNVPREYRVIIPSYFRPQLFPARRGADDRTAPINPSGLRPNGFGDLYIANQTARQVLRPHQAHIAGFAPAASGSYGANDPVRRYITLVDLAIDEDLDGDGNPDGDVNGDGASDGVKAKSGDTNRVIFPFPLQVDLDGDGNSNEMGVWTNPFQAQTGQRVNYELDADADGDGVRDAIWMDLDFPIMTLDDGRQFVPMFAIKIIDADSLLNVNAHGNHNGLYVRGQDGAIEVIGPDADASPTGMPIAGSASGGYSKDGLAELLSFHQSNLGISPWEVNLSLALTSNLRLADVPANPNQPHPTLSQVDPAAAEPTNVLNIDDVIATQFDLAWNYNYNANPSPPGPVTMPSQPLAYTAAELRSPSVGALSNLEALMILNGRREFETLRDGRVRESRQQLLGRYADRFKIRELYRRLGVGDPDFPDGLSDGEPIPSPLPGGWYVDDDGDSNLLGLSSAFNDSTNIYPNGDDEPDADDDLNAPGLRTGNFRREGGSFYYDQDLYGVQYPPAVHPLDYLGVGSAYLNLDSTDANYLQRILEGGPQELASPRTNPSVWPSYVDRNNTRPVRPAPGGVPLELRLWQYQKMAGDVGDTDLTGVQPWHQALAAGELQSANKMYDFLIDEPNEMILEPSFQDPEYDAVFPPYELEGLHLSASDFSKIQGGSRLRELASINLDRIKNSQRAKVAQRLTTDSWDRLEPGQTRWRFAAGGLATPSADFDRLWEFNLWNDGDTSAGDFYTARETFPPEFGPTGSRILAGTDDDPVRESLRLLLKNERGYGGSISGELRYPRRKLNLNRILSGEDAIVPAIGNIDRRAFNDNGEPRFRNLTPHPNVTELLKIGPISAVSIPAMVHINVNINTQPGIAPPFADLGLDPNVSQADRESLVVAQEWWARYDRQRLARDIYVLLYTLGLGDDNYNVATTAYPTTPDNDSNGVNDLVDEMAQFAVNYVDALDRDNVITRFEYDGNLSDGWQWTSGTSPSAYGVEAQQLTFSEVVWTRTHRDSSDYNKTPWDESDRMHQFLHVELRSTSPFPIELADETWRIVRQETPTGGARTARLMFKRDGVNSLTIGPGENFTIGANDGYNGPSGPDTADMYVDYNGDMTFEAIVPDALPATTLSTVEPQTDLDIVTTATMPINYPNYYDIQTGGNLEPTRMVGTTTDNASDDTTVSFDLVLERRRHLNAEDRLGQNDDAFDSLGPDWVEVDRIRVFPNDFSPAGDSEADMKSEIEGEIHSQFRYEPLDGFQDLDEYQNNGTNMASGTTISTTSATAPNLNHTIDSKIDASNRHLRNVFNPGSPPPPPPATDPATEPFKLWQPHFDRDFSSIFELFSVPLFGPDETTRRLVDGGGNISGFDKIAGPPKVASLAGRRFTNTDPLGDSDGTATTIDDDNRWYRLLEYIEIPGRAEQAIRERLTQIIRTPGKLNLNTIRHEEVLAALIDDPMILKFQSTNGWMTDVDEALEPLEATTVFTNWMDEFRLSREGIDPVNYFPTNPSDRTYVPLPGIPGLPADPADNTAAEYGASGRPQFGAMPFRELSYLDPNRQFNVPTSGTSPPTPTTVDPTAHTVLRSHVPQIGAGATAEVIQRRNMMGELGLFEARSTTDIGTDAFDYHTRNRLLAKVTNNSTTRSNVFLCWIVVEFFEAHQPLPTVNPEIVQVGARLEGSPTHRGFFVIDRTKLEQAVDQDSLTPAANTGDGNGRNDAFRFDWRDFVIHRRTIQ